MLKQYTYQFQPVTTASLQSHVDASCAFVSITANLLVVDCDDSMEDDLDAYLTSLGFIFVSSV